MLWNANYVKVMMANFALYFAFYILTPLLPLYLSEQFGASKDTIGIVLSGYTWAALVIRPFSGFIVDCFDRRKGLLVFFFLFFIFFAGYVAASTLLMFAIVRTMHGAPFGALTVANQTVAIDVLPAKRRNEGMGYYGLGNNLAMAVAPSIAIYVYHATGSFSVLFWIALVVAGAGLGVDMTVKIPKKPVTARRPQLSLDRFFLTRAWLLAVNIACFSFCFGVLSNYLAIYSKEQMGITTGTGTYFLILSAGLVVSRIQGAAGLRKGRLTQNAAHGILLALIGYILFVALPDEWGYYLSAVLIGLGNGHMYPAFLNMFISVAQNNQRGTANSSILTAWDFGFGFGILAGGVVAENFGYQAAFWVTSAVNALGVLLFFLATQSFYKNRAVS